MKIAKRLLRDFQSFARSWTVDLKHCKIRVNTISPGAIATPMVGSVQGKEQAEQFNIDFRESIPKILQRLRIEHRYFRLELIQIEEASEVSSQKAIEMLKG